MLGLYALLIPFAPFAAAVAGNAVDTRIAIWIPNPCDTFGNLPKALQRAFLQYVEKNNVPNLDSIDAYRRYTIVSIEPEATDTWRWNSRDLIPTVTSAYNTADCSTYYPPPTGVRPTESPTAVVTDSMPSPATTSLTSKATDNGAHTTVPRKITTGTLTLNTSPDSVLTTLVTSHAEIPPTNAPSKGGKTTGSSTATINAAVPISTSNTATAPPASMPTQQSKPPGSSTVTDTALTTRTAELLTGTHSLKPVPTNIKPWCWPPGANNETLRLSIQTDWVYKSISDACGSLQSKPPLSAYLWRPNESFFIDKDHHIRLDLMLQSNTGYKPLAIAPGSSEGYKACNQIFQHTWEACKVTSYMGGILLYDDIEWTVSITPYDGPAITL